MNADLARRAGVRVGDSPRCFAAIRPGVEACTAERCETCGELAALLGLPATFGRRYGDRVAIVDAGRCPSVAALALLAREAGLGVALAASTLVLSASPAAALDVAGLLTDEPAALVVDLAEPVVADGHSCADD